MKRRTLLHQVMYASSIAASSALPFGISRMLLPEAQAYPKKQHIRPPGALADDQQFISACIGCGLCAEVCPPNCILFHKRDGGQQANVPYINPEVKACVLCEKCMPVCPTAALQETARDKVDMGIAQIDQTACYPWVDRGICGACVTVCPLGDKAINFEFANIYRPLVQKGCVGCGMCVEVCPHPSLPIKIVERTKGTVVKHTL